MRVEKIGDATLYLGDCLEILPTLGPVDAVVTDPPYGMDFQSARRTEAERFAKIANDEKPFIWWLPGAFKAVKDGGSIACFCRWDSQEAFRWAMDLAGFEVKSQVIWDRQAHGLGDLKAQFAPQHDVVWFGVRGPFRFPGNRPKSVLSHMRIPGDGLTHPNEKPVALLGELALAVTAPGQTILDTFMGSGTTGVAALKLGRKFIGIEIDEKYFDIACRRIADAHAQPDLFIKPAAEPEQESLFPPGLSNEGNK